MSISSIQALETSKAPQTLKLTKLEDLEPILEKQWTLLKERDFKKNADRHDSHGTYTVSKVTKFIQKYHVDAREVSINMQRITFWLPDPEALYNWEKEWVNAALIKIEPSNEKIESLLSTFFNQMRFDDFFINKDHYSTNPELSYSRNPTIYV